jgi:hypothetical protein
MMRVSPCSATGSLVDRYALHLDIGDSDRFVDRVFLFVCHRPHARGSCGGPLRADDDMFLEDRDDLLVVRVSSLIAGTP